MAATVESSRVRRAGVVGAGTMGAGIAQVLAQSGVDVQLVDLDGAVLDRAVDQIGRDLRKAHDRGHCSQQDIVDIRGRLHPSQEMDSLEAAELVVEAVPERLDIKLDVFSRLSEICADETVLATNTSSLLVSAVAAGTPRPDRVIGLHFFNPAPRMRLVEVVAGVQTSEQALALGVDTVQAMGKHPVIARDGVGFLVNRLARPFYGEALKLVQEGVASVDQVDRICRLAGGFRMGPFELIDLIGVDVNFEIARSFYEQSFGEPRWRPNPIQARLVSAGHHGRKSGRGFYDYSSAAHRAADPEAPEPAGGDGRLIVVAGDGLVADLLRERARCAGFVLHDPGDVGNEEPWLTVDTTLHGDGVAEAEGPLVVSCAASSLKRRRAAGAAGFHVLPVAGTRLVELAAGAHTDPQATARASAFFAALGLAVEHVGDAPGLVMGRIAAQLVNEAHFAVAEGVGTAQDVDAGTTLGLNYPHGSCALGALLGAEYVRAVLDGLYDERHEERYRLAPTLCG